MLATLCVGGMPDEHMHVIGHQSAFFHDTLLLLRSPVQHVFQVPTDHPIEDFLAILGCKNYVVWAFPCAMVQVLGVGRHGRSPWSCFERSKHSGRSSAYVKHRDSSSIAGGLALGIVTPSDTVGVGAGQGPTLGQD